MSDEKSGKRLPLGLEVAGMFASPIHVAVICPANAAVTMLLNKMAAHRAIFILMQQIPVAVGNISRANGQPNIEIYPLLVFSMQQREFESWMKCKYEAVAMYQMADIMNDKIMTPERN